MEKEIAIYHGSNKIIKNRYMVRETRLMTTEEGFTVRRMWNLQRNGQCRIYNIALACDIIAEPYV